MDYPQLPQSNEAGVGCPALAQRGIISFPRHSQFLKYPSQFKSTLITAICACLPVLSSSEHKGRTSCTLPAYSQTKQVTPTTQAPQKPHIFFFITMHVPWDFSSLTVLFTFLGGVNIFFDSASRGTGQGSRLTILLCNPGKAAMCDMPSTVPDTEWAQQVRAAFPPPQWAHSGGDLSVSLEQMMLSWTPRSSSYYITETNILLMQK